MRDSLDIDPILREYLEQRRGLTGDEIQRLLVEWNNQGSLAEFLASKALLDRTTARMLATAAKGLLGSTHDEVRTVLGVRLKSRRRDNATSSAEDAPASTEDPTPTPTPNLLAPILGDRASGKQPSSLPIAIKDVAEPSPDPTPPTQPHPPVRSTVATTEEEPKVVRDPAAPSATQASSPATTPHPSPTNDSRPPKKQSGRRGFLGASEEELRHILGARGEGGRSAKPDLASAQPGSPTTPITPTSAASVTPITPSATTIEPSTPANKPSTSTSTASTSTSVPSAPASSAPVAVSSAPVAPSSAPVAPSSAPVAASAPSASASAPSVPTSSPSVPTSAPPASSSLPASTPVTSRPVPASRNSKPDSAPKLSHKQPSMSDPQISAVHSGSDLLPLKPSSAGGEPKVGMYLDRYYLEESIGEGATATIFRSFHKLLRIPVAIKVYKREAMADDPIGVQRFLSEAQMLIRLEHPNIVRVLDIAVRDGAPYIVFEYVGELSLQGMINNMGLLPPLRIAQIGAQVSAALEAAAKSGLLHRDVKPDNILIRKDGLAKLADFGIATHRAKDGRTADELARAGLISGTPQYISPEQITTPDQIDFRADIYSLGATLYHSGCGHPPFERDSIDELLHAQLEDFPIPLHSLDPNFDPELSEIIAKMLNKEPIDRFATLAELRKRLESVANRIQGEVSERRRNAMSSGAMPTFVFAPEGSSTPTSSSEDRPVSIAREKSGSVVKRSGSKSSPSDSQLALREPSQGLRTAVWAVAALVVCLVLYVLIRTAH